MTEHERVVRKALAALNEALIELDLYDRDEHAIKAAIGVLNGYLR